MRTTHEGSRGQIIVMALATLAFLALGCSEHKEQASVTEQAAPIAAVQETPGQAVVASTPEAGSLGQGEETALGDSLPPDVTAFAPDSLVVPGSVVEITAQASTDVTGMTLTDRLGRKHPFTYDADARAWRVYYRVPLRVGTGELGLSITATNGANRWKRVWVFLKTQGEEPKDTGGI